MKRKPGLDRNAALRARPVRTPAVRVEERDNGGIKVTVRLVRHRTLRWLAGPKEIERTFGLDALGREVYEACDGRTDAKAIIARLEKRHRLCRAEAELAVTTFLKTLVGKGLIVMAVDRQE